MQSATKPIAIRVKKTQSRTKVGTCRSYDEAQPVPSFVRSLTPELDKTQTKPTKGRKRIFSE